jgi:polyisoprenoid-binding protein YceI
MRSTLAPEIRRQAQGQATWQLDPAYTLIEVSSRHLRLATVKRRFGSFRGTITIDRDDPARSSVEVAIDAANLDTPTDTEKRRPPWTGVLDAAHYPTIRFRGRRVAVPAGATVRPGLAFRVLGELTIRGSTRDIALDAVWHGEGDEGDGPRGTRVIVFSASATISRQAFGLTWDEALETGGLLVGDEITVGFEVRATPQPAAA